MRSRVSSHRDLKSGASGPTSTIADIWKYVYPNTPVTHPLPGARPGHEAQDGPAEAGLSFFAVSPRASDSRGGPWAARPRPSSCLIRLPRPLGKRRLPSAGDAKVCSQGTDPGDGAAD